MPNVVTIGTFDGLHLGHTRLIEKCRKIAGPDGLVTVGINSNEIVARRGKKGVQDSAHRAEVIYALAGVTDTFIWTGDLEDLAGQLSAIEENFLVVGTDWVGGYHLLVGLDESWLEEHLLTILYVDYTDGVSSTKLRERRDEPK